MFYDNQDESGWWLGKLEKTGVVGWFAPDLVVPLDEQITPAASTTTNGNGNASNGSKSNGNKSAFTFGDNKSNNSKSKTKSKTKSKNNPTSPKSAPPKKASPPKGSKKKASPPKGSSSTKTKSHSKKPSAPSGPKKKASPPKGSKKSSKSPPKKNGNGNASTASSAADVGDEPSVTIPYGKLKAKQFGGVDVDKAKLETYLSNEEFFAQFKMSRAEFASKPAWKQRNMKKAAGLF